MLYNRTIKQSKTFLQNHAVLGLFFKKIALGRRLHSQSTIARCKIWSDSKITIPKPHLSFLQYFTWVSWGCFSPAQIWHGANHSSVNLFSFFSFQFFFFFCSVFSAPLKSLSSSASFSCIFFFSGICLLLSSVSFFLLSSLFFYSLFF